MKAAIKNLLHFLKSHRLLAFIICIVQALSIFSLFAIYSKTYSYTQLDAYYTDEVKTYTVALADEDRAGDYSAQFEKFLAAFADTEQITAVFNAPYYTYAYYMYPEKQSIYIYFGSYFDEKQFYTDEKAVVAGLYGRTGEESFSIDELVCEVGADYEVAGESYTVIGSANNFWDEISYHSLTARQNKGVESISFLLRAVPGERENTQILEMLAALFPNSEISPPADEAYDSINTTVWEKAASISICLLAVITLSYIFKYLFEMRKKTNAICLIVGIKKRQIAFSLFAELILSSSLIYIASALLFRFVFSKVMLNLDIIKYEIGIKQYLYLYLVFIVCITLIIGINILTSVGKSSGELYRRSA